MTRPPVEDFLEVAALLVSCVLNDGHMERGGSGALPVDDATTLKFNAQMREWQDLIRERGPEHAAERLVNDVWFPAVMDCAPEVATPLMDFWLETVVSGR